MIAKRIFFLAALFLLFQPEGYTQSLANKIKVSDDIELIRLSDKAFIHISYLHVPPYGYVGANGLLLIENGEAFLFDSPWNDQQTEKLVTFITDSLQAKVSTFVPNHWHDDCMGGLAYLSRHNVKSYANQMTIDIAKEKNLPIPQQSFKDSLSLKLNDIAVHCYYLGGGHAADNIVVWIPSEKILFPACMIKDMKSENLGNLSAAKVDEWPATIQKVIKKFPSAEIIIPGHGAYGGKELLTHTLKLLKK